MSLLRALSALLPPGAVSTLEGPGLLAALAGRGIDHTYCGLVRMRVPKAIYLWAGLLFRFFGAVIY